MQGQGNYVAASYAYFAAADADVHAFYTDSGVYRTDFAASDTDFNAYGAVSAVFMLALHLSCSFSSSLFDSAPADAGHDNK